MICNSVFSFLVTGMSYRVEILFATSPHHVQVSTNCYSFSPVAMGTSSMWKFYSSKPLALSVYVAVLACFEFV